MNSFFIKKERRSRLHQDITFRIAVKHLAGSDIPENYYQMNIGDRPSKRSFRQPDQTKGASAKIVAQNSLRPYDIC